MATVQIRRENVFFETEVRSFVEKNFSGKIVERVHFARVVFIAIVTIISRIFFVLMEIWWGLLSKMNGRKSMTPTIYFISFFVDYIPLI